MEWNILSFAVGLWVVAFFSHLLPIRYCLITVAIIFAGYLFFPQPYLRKTLLLFTAFALGVTWNNYLSWQWQNHRIDKSAEVTVTGKIITLPVDHLFYTNFEMDTEQINGIRDRKHLLLSWQKPHPVLQVNDRWQLIAHLKPPHGLVNFSPFNRLRNMWTQNIHGTGYVVTKKPYQHLASLQWHFFWHEQFH